MSKDLRPRWKVHFKPILIVNIIKSFLAASKTIVETLHFHRVDICSGFKQNSATVTYCIYIYIYILYIYIYIYIYIPNNK